MHFGFFCVGLIFPALLFLPHFLWTKNKPKEKDEKKPLVLAIGPIEIHWQHKREQK